VFQNILVQHESVDAQRFGRQKFKDLCAACGISGIKVEDLDILLHKPCLITVSIRKDKNGEYPDKNEVSRVTAVARNWNGGPTPKAESAPLNDDIPF